MTKEDRENWLTVAMAEIADIPSDYFAEACKQARRTADHPSKIVPAICKFNPGEWQNKAYLERTLKAERARLENFDAPRLEQQHHEPDDALKASMRKLVEELRAKEREVAAGTSSDAV